MSNNRNPSQMMSIEQVTERGRISSDHGAKNPATTKYTQGQVNFILPESFILGKNDLLENNTSSELEESDTESDVSFEERLNSCHSKLMVREILKYFELKGALKQSKKAQHQQMPRAVQMMKDIEERIFEEIKKLYGSNEVEKIKLAIKFIRRNENLTKIYYEVIKSLPSHLQASVFIFFKHSVMTYFEVRQQIGSQQSKLSEEIIKDYFGQNIQKIIEQVEQDEKLQSIYNSKHDQGIKKRFEMFLREWMESFFLAREGFPCTAFKKESKNLKGRARVMQSGMQKEKSKKIKKF